MEKKFFLEKISPHNKENVKLGIFVHFQLSGFSQTPYQYSAMWVRVKTVRVRGLKLCGSGA